jgi:hypothetical protein
LCIPPSVPVRTGAIGVRGASEATCWSSCVRLAAISCSSSVGSVEAGHGPVGLNLAFGSVGVRLKT